MKLYGKLGAKGRLVIPSELRERYGLKSGTRISMESKEDCIIVRPITNAFIESLRGCLKGPSLSDIRNRCH
jgi:AbrB family looped-hinge helix DNA binding protein